MALYTKYRALLPELAKHVLEDADPNFARKVNIGDFIVADKNFGCGSSREHAPTVIKLAGITAVIAKSFARIFYRNAVNIGLPVFECCHVAIDDGDILSLDLSSGIIVNKTKEIRMEACCLPKIMVNILSDGGLVEHIKKHGGFVVE